MENKKSVTLFVLTNEASRTRQIKIPYGYLKIGGTALCALALIFSFVVFDYMRLKGHNVELSTLKKENTAQKLEMQGIAAKIRDMEVQLSKLNLFDKKLRIIANIAPSSASERAGQLMGIGGESSPEEEGYLATPKAKVEKLVEKMHTDMTQLEERAKVQETSFTELQEDLKKQSSLLASMPSIWPSHGWITSGFGERVNPFTGFRQMHKGLDIANSVGTSVLAPADGVVVEAVRDGALGKMIAISHGYGTKTMYGHLSEIAVHVGQRVKRGDRIATMGNTGHSTGPHLHYEVSINGISVNPARYILN